MTTYIFNDSGTEAEAITDYADYIEEDDTLFKDTRKLTKIINGITLFSVL